MVHTDHPTAVHALTHRASLSYRIANGVSYVINPFVLPPIGMGVVLAYLGASSAEIVMLAAVTLIFSCLVPLAIVMHMVNRGETTSVDVPERHKRTRPLLAGLLSYALATAVVGALSRTAAPFITALIGINIINMAAIVLINLKWKISIHLIGMASFISTLLFAAWATPMDLGALSNDGLQLRPSILFALLPILPLLMWARVRVGAHSVPQVIAGTLFGLVVPYLQLYWFAAYVM